MITDKQSVSSISNKRKKRKEKLLICRKNIFFWCNEIKFDIQRDVFWFEETNFSL